MNIAYFTDTYKPQVNGVVSSIESFRQALEARGHKVYIFAPKMKGVKELDNVFYFRSIPYFFHKEVRLSWPSSRQLFKFSDLNIDIIHSQTPFTLGELALALGRLFKIPVMHTYHTFFSAYTHYVPFSPRQLTEAVARKASKRYCNACKLVLVPSQMMGDFLLSYGVTTPIEILPTGIDIFKPTVQDTLNLKHRYHIPLENKLLLYVGRLVKEKNIIFLLETFKIIVSQNPNITFMLVGDGPERKNLEKHARHVGLKHKVIFTGYLDKSEVFNCYESADLFVFSSKTETQGLVLAEAMSVGLPAVAVNAMGVSDILHDGIGGVLCEELTTEFSETVLDLLNDKQKWEQKSGEAMVKVEDWTTDVMVERLIGFYERVLNR